MIARLRGRRVYIETNVFIYALEGEPSLRAQVVPLFSALDAGEVEGVTSELALAEALVQPPRTQDTALAGRYERLIAPRPHLARLSVTLEVWREAARIRAGTQLRLPDAVHLSTARQAQCAVFVTGDVRLTRQASVPGVLVGGA